MNPEATPPAHDTGTTTAATLHMEAVPDGAPSMRIGEGIASITFVNATALYIGPSKPATGD